MVATVRFEESSMPRTPIAAALAAAALVAAAASSSASTTASYPTAPKDLPFVYATKDHAAAKSSRPSTRQYGYGRPVYLVGDSMAAQHADGLRVATQQQRRALKPRTRSAGTFKLPGNRFTAEGQYNNRILAQITADKARKPIVVIVQQRPGTTTNLRRTIWTLRKEGVSVRLATATSAPGNGAPAGAAVTKEVAKSLGLRLLDTDAIADRGTVQWGVIVWRGVGNHTTGSFSKKVLAGHDRALIR